MARSVSMAPVLALLLPLLQGACTWTPPEEPRPSTSNEPPPALAVAAEPPSPTACVTAPIVNNGSRRHMRIALTFDACTTHKNEYNERVIHTLLETRTPATLFIGGGWAQANSRRLEELAQYGLFEFGNHTFSHAHMTQVKENSKALEEFLRTQRAVYDLTGHIPRYFRPPFGEVDTRVAWLASQAGLTALNFDLPAGDSGETVTPKRLSDWVLKKASPGGIVVLHMNHNRFPTADALPEIIRGLRKRGFELVTVAQLLEDAPPPSSCQLTDAPAAPLVVAQVTP
jgi:peptidoglycan-N-acetylglucosamine deacetylase